MKRNSTVLVVERDTSISSSLEKKLRQMGLNPFCDYAISKSTEELASLDPGLAILGPGLDETESQCYFQRLKIIDPSMPIVVLVKGGGQQGQLGRLPFQATFYVDSESGIPEVTSRIGSCLRHVEASEVLPDCPIIIGRSESLEDIKKRIWNIANKDVTVLVTGETGTGKEMIARSVHWHSPRSKGPLVKISCGALPDHLVESEVLGFRKGAFTGAYRDKPGQVELANHGTLFIDEIGDLSLFLQAKFLQVLEDNVFIRLGETKDTLVDARVVAVTNKDLWQMVRQGAFRKDLFYRLNVFHIRVPPLRERKEDIPLLANYFLDKYCYQLKRDSIELPGEIAHWFQSYDWPGNIRELENVIRRGMALKDWSFVYQELRNRTPEDEKEAGAFVDDDPEVGFWGDESIKDFVVREGSSLKQITKVYVTAAERRAILETLEKTRWNRKKAARLLNVSYKTLLKRIEEYDLKL